MFDPSSLRPLYAPDSIAIVGASNNAQKFGGRPIKYMGDTGYGGKIYPVHPRETEIQGHRVYSDVREIGAPVDLALIAVPGPSVLEAANACAEAGVGAAVVIASGFAETGDAQGAMWQDELVALSRRSGMRILGPNCMGTASMLTGAITTFATVFEFYTLRPGGIAMASQSGAMGAHLLVLAAQRGLGSHSMITSGNECDVDVAQCIGYLANDPTVSVIACYLEGCKNPDALIESLEMARRNGKPVVALKVGATDIGAEAAGTHTAALAGSDAVFDAVLKEGGVHRARNLDEMLLVASACSAGKYPNGKRLGIVTISGGGGVMAADAAVDNGLEVPAMPEHAQKKLKALMPFAAVRNPVDTTAQVSSNFALLATNLEVMLDEGDCDALVIFLAYVALSPRVWANLSEILFKFRERYPDALVVCTGMYKREDAAALEERGYLVVEDLTNGVAMVAVLERFARHFERPARAIQTTTLPAPADIPGALNESAALALLGAAGVPVLPTRVVTTAAEAAAAAQALGGALAVKLLSADIAHKSDIGGVKLGVEGPEAAAAAFEAVIAAAKRSAPNAKIDGAVIAPMVSGGVETILGVVMDPVFGPAVMLGLGGVFAEILDDVVIRRAPVDEQGATAMVEALRGKMLLQGARGSEPSDVPALIAAIVALSQFAYVNRERISGVDINPFLVRPAGQGAVALDALIVPRNE
jgi:acyl-CoA synthetase (NDP forming)